MQYRKILIYSLVLARAAAFATPAKEDISVYEDPKALAALVAERKPDWHLVDVRTSTEYADGHIPASINIPYTEIGTNPPTEDRQALIVVYCRSGARSSTAKAILESLGYSRVVDFGSVSRWTGALVRGSDPE
jgi:rhodanese-related sulfurtransferase